MPALGWYVDAVAAMNPLAWEGDAEIRRRTK